MDKSTTDQKQIWETDKLKTKQLTGERPLGDFLIFTCKLISN